MPAPLLPRKRFLLAAGLLPLTACGHRLSAPSLPRMPYSAHDPAAAGERIRRVRSGTPSRIEGYCSAASVAVDDALSFHVRALSPNAYFKVEIFRQGPSETLVHSGFGPTFIPGTPQDDSVLLVSGCNWPAGYSLTVPSSWRSGVYYARLTSYQDPDTPTYDRTTLGFVVRAPARNASIILGIADSTNQAYNAWGGMSLYTSPRAPRLSYARPYEDDVAPIGFYEIPFIRWAESNGFAIDFCSSVDLHARPNLLNGYRLFLSVGHDEYWSKQMRDNVEGFIAGGGNACFFSGNVCYWQIRLESGNRQLVCYKDASLDPIQNPALGGPTTLWRDQSVNRPGNSMVGAGYLAGAGWWSDQGHPNRLRGYTVQNANHWIYNATGLRNGDLLGQTASLATTIVGYETDAAAYRLINNVAMPTGADGSPTDFQILGYADLTDWPNGDNGQAGYATMGLYQHNGSTVFTAGTINWVGGLGGSSSAVETITRNLLTVLASGGPPPTPTPQPTATSSPSPSPSATPTATPAPQSTASPAPQPTGTSGFDPTPNPNRSLPVVNRRPG